MYFVYSTQSSLTYNGSLSNYSLLMMSGEQLECDQLWFTHNASTRK